MATEYISLDEVIEIATSYCPDDDGTCEKAGTDLREMLDEIEAIPPADVVSRDCYDRILAENDTMRKQLAQIGKNPGDKMDDVLPVVRAHWIYHEDDYGDYYECSNCHDEYVVYEGDMCWKRCPTCGAEMITGKEANGRT